VEIILLQLRKDDLRQNFSDQEPFYIIGFKNKVIQNLNSLADKFM